MLDTIERILTQKTEPPVSASTHKLTMEIVSGVTYTYHANRSCEHLLELWNKVKRPGDPEFVSWLHMIVSDVAGHPPSRRLPPHHAPCTPPRGTPGAHRIPAPRYHFDGPRPEIPPCLTCPVCSFAAALGAALAWQAQHARSWRFAAAARSPVFGTARP